MLTVAEALRAVLTHARPLPSERVELLSAIGSTLDEDVVADLDLPPFDKALVDGFAVRSADFAGSEPVGLDVVDEILAGGTPNRRIEAGQAAAIMTGAPLPDGADAVVMVEKTRRDGDRVVISGIVASGQNRLLRGREMRSGEIVLPRGVVLGPGKLGVAASVGAARLLVRPKPTVAIVATGDELVTIDRTPGPGQIRNSNTVLLAALTELDGGSSRPMPIAPDRPESLREAFGRCLFDEGVDVLLVSGGVSAGRRDLVPEALESIGVGCLFHKVQVKPGKPLWFGVGPDREGRPPALVFGLPGNPVSGLVGFLLFVRPALRRLQGIATEAEPPILLALATDYDHDDDRDVYRPARLVDGLDGSSQVEPLGWAGSSDLRAAASADGFAIFPAGVRIYVRGDRVGFLSISPSRFPRANSY